MHIRSIRARFAVEYSALKNAIDRCTRQNHPQYDDYGGRGIEVHPDFMCPVHGFTIFLAEVGRKRDPSLTLDRLDNSRGYEPGNVAWVSRRANMQNRRPNAAQAKDLGWGIGHYLTLTAKGHLRRCPSPIIERNGVRKTVKEWSQELGLSTATITQRIHRGWSAEQALNPLLFSPHGQPRSDQPNR